VDAEDAGTHDSSGCRRRGQVVTESFYRSISTAVDRIALETWGPTVLRAAYQVATGQAPPSHLVDVAERARRTIYVPEARVIVRHR
jgi:hypothetical protein